MDKLSNLIANIKQAILFKKLKAIVPLNNLNLNICSCLYKNGYISYYKIINKKKFGKNNKINNYHDCIEIGLKKYKGKYIFWYIERVTRPGRKIYWSVEELKKNYKLKGEYFVNTSKGILLSKECILQNISGEILFKLYN